TIQYISYRIAMDYLKMEQYQASFPWFEDAVGNEQQNPLYFQHYGDALARAGKLEKALHIYQRGKEISTIDHQLQMRISALEKAMQLRSKPDPYKIQRVEILNSNYRDFAPGWYNGKLVFASTRIAKKNERIDGSTGQPYAELYVAGFDEKSGQWELPEKMQGPFTAWYNNICFTYEPATGEAFSMKGDKNSQQYILLFSRYEEEKKGWTRNHKLNFNTDNYSIGYPVLSDDGQILYFASDMSGGFGGYDIWKAYRKKDGSWGLPINAGKKINSNADEIYPFLMGDSILIFASDGHKGLGGLDLYYSVQKNFEFQEAFNLGHPFNTSANDYAMIIRKGEENGLICSNRNNESSDDIYSFEESPLKHMVSGTIWDAITKTKINKADIIIRQGVEEIRIQSDENGHYEYFGLMPEESYELIVEKENYYPESRKLEINKKIQGDLSNNTIMDFQLSKLEYPLAIKGRVLDRSNELPMRGILVEISGAEDFHSLSYTDEGGHYIFENLKPKNTYNIRVSKEEYFSESREIQLPDADAPDTLSKANGYDTDFLLTKIEKKKEIALNNIYYDFDKASLRPESITELNKLASMLRETPDVVIQISSHTDTQGAEWYNQKLSEKRAQTVVNALIEKGINPKRLKARGYGESKPLIPGAGSEEEHQQNRRTTFIVLEADQSLPNEIIKDENMQKNQLTYRIQLMTTRQPIPGHQLFKQILVNVPDTDVFVSRDNGMYKYEIGSRNNLKAASELKQKLAELGYTDCFTNAYYQGNEISIQKAKELEKNPN
ncbi:MAG: OmpA family protein, partial [Bacteroidales bacterium]|nr:OmpA family protein [Bacteroidales bacterium]